MYINLMVTTKQNLTNKRYTKNKKKEPKLHTKEKGNQYILCSPLWESAPSANNRITHSWLRWI